MSTECYVYIVLPGDTRFVTAGKFVLAADRQGVASGKFVYGRSYLGRRNAVAIDPVELKLSTDTFKTRRLAGFFGALRDAGPDYWGRRVIERHSGKTQFSELDYLLYSPDNRAGALSFGLNRTPPPPHRNYSQTIHLPALQKLADAILADDALPKDQDAMQVQTLVTGHYRASFHSRERVRSMPASLTNEATRLWARNGHGEVHSSGNHSLKRNRTVA